MSAFSSSSFSTSAFSVDAFFFDVGGPVLPTWISGVSHFRNADGVDMRSHTVDGYERHGVSKDLTSSVSEVWFIPS